MTVDIDTFIHHGILSVSLESTVLLSNAYTTRAMLTACEFVKQCKSYSTVSLINNS